MALVHTIKCVFYCKHVKRVLLFRNMNFAIKCSDFLHLFRHPFLYIYIYKRITIVLPMVKTRSRRSIFIRKIFLRGKMVDSPSLYSGNSGWKCKGIVLFYEPRENDFQQALRFTKRKGLCSFSDP